MYEPADLTMEAHEMINDVIMSVKGPYPPFPKKINLADLATLVEEVWDDDFDWFYVCYQYLIPINHYP